MEYFGKVARCKAGKIGVVTSIGFFEDGLTVVGNLTKTQKEKYEIFFSYSSRPI